MKINEELKVLEYIEAVTNKKETADALYESIMNPSSGKSFSTVDELMQDLESEEE